MNQPINRLLLAVCALFVAAGATMIYGQVPTYRATDAQTRNLLTRIETKTNAFQQTMNDALNRGRWNNTVTEDTIRTYILEFANSTDTLRQRIDSRRPINNEVNDVLTRASYIDRFMNQNNVTAYSRTQWTSIRTDLNTLARYYNMSWNWNQTGPIIPTPGYPPNVNDAQARNLIRRIETKTDTFKNEINTALNRSPLNNTQREDNVLNYITGFEGATDRLRTQFDARQPVSNEVNDVLTQAAYIDRFMARNRLAYRAENQWVSLRTDLNTLASLYNVSWNWNRTLPPYPGNSQTGGYPTGGYPGGSLDTRLTGTYRLNTSVSDNVSDVIGRSINSYPTGTQRDNAQRNLERRLNSPDMIAIEKNGRTVTLASSLSPQVTFQADGVTHTETNARGRTTRTTATSDYNGVEINYQGDRGNEFNVNFETSGNDRLRVTRRIFLDNRNETVTVNSVYDKIDRVAQWSTVNNGTYPGNNDTSGIGNDFYVPNGTRIEATLRSNVTTRASQVGDRFTMEVTSPVQYQGAIIEGRVAGIGKSGQLSGRANVSLDFDTIRFTDGRTYRFAGLIDSARAVNGDSVSVNNEGAIRDRNQTTTTATRAGIGAAVGAIIGAIAGGGQGAAIGAAVGAGAGAGSVLIQGRDNIDLAQGSTFTITATSPNNVGYVR
jgi:Predicted outer membrane lipoprotein